MAEISYLPSNNPTDIVTVMSLDSIYPHMAVGNPDFYNKLKHDVMLRGLEHPLVVVPMTVAEWRTMQDLSVDMLDPPDLPDTATVHQVRCGNNRYFLAKELGYTLIDCIITSIQGANKICNEQRTDFK